MSDESEQQQESNEQQPGLIRRFFRLIGVRFPREADRWLVFTRRFPFVVLGCFVVGVIGSGWFVHHSSTPEFCDNCHYIRPYVESWRESTHSDVTCGKCHFPPTFGGYARRKFMGIVEVVRTVTGSQPPKPTAEVLDASCMQEGCHESRLLQGEVLLKDRYRFDHGTHLGELRRGKRLRCTSCHSQIVQGEHMTVTESVCFTCHFKGKIHERYLDPIAGCTSCHDVPEGAIEVTEEKTFDHAPFVEQGAACIKCHFDSTVGEGDVPRQVCLDCHDKPERLAKYPDSTFLHDQHVSESKVECFQCHSDIRHGLQPEPYDQTDTCAACHTNHNLQRNLYVGLGPGGRDGAPSSHSLMQVDCVACHEFPIEHGQQGVGMVTYEVGEKACVECHGEGVEGMMDMWTTGLQSQLDDLNEALREAEKAVQGVPEGAETRKKLEEARRIHGFVDEAHGVHNPTFAFELLDRAGTLVQEALAATEGR